MPDRRNPEKQFRFINGTEFSRSAPLLMPADFDAAFDHAIWLSEPSTRASKIIVLRTPEWELGLEEFGTPLPRNRVPRPAADVAMFAPACDVECANGFKTLVNNCNLLVNDDRHWFGAAGAAESITNWSECEFVMLTGSINDIAGNVDAVVSSAENNLPSVWAVTATPALQNEEEKKQLQALRSRVELLINLSLGDERSQTAVARKARDDNATIDRLYHQIVINLIEAITVRGLICIDIADIRCCLGNADPIHVGFGSSRGENRGPEACEAAVSHLPFGEQTVRDASGIFVHVVGSPDMSLGEWDALGNLIKELANEDATVAISAILNSDLTDEMKVMVLARANLETAEPEVEKT